MSELMHVNVIVMLSQQVSLVSSLISIHVNGTFIKAGWYNREKKITDLLLHGAAVIRAWQSLFERIGWIQGLGSSLEHE